MDTNQKMPVMDIGNENMKKMERELIRASLTDLAPLLDAIMKDKIVFGDVAIPLAPQAGQA